LFASYGHLPVPAPISGDKGIKAGPDSPSILRRGSKAQDNAKDWENFRLVGPPPASTVVQQRFESNINSSPSVRKPLIAEEQDKEIESAENGMALRERKQKGRAEGESVPRKEGNSLSNLKSSLLGLFGRSSDSVVPAPGAPVRKKDSKTKTMEQVSFDFCFCCSVVLLLYL
jgi:hypothetical protein